MARRRIVELGDSKLRKNTRSVEKFDARLHNLLDDMANTMYYADGVGLAAPQVGILRQVVVVDVGEGLIELINPEMIYQEGEEAGAEGCLSIPGRRGLVVRPTKVIVKAQDRNGTPFTMEAEGFLARAFCHELDHLQGRLYIDIMERELFEEDFADTEEEEETEVDQ